MKTLIITAHPSTKWFTHKIAKAYSRWAKIAWKKVEILNLYDKEYKQDFLEFEDQREFGEDPVRKIIQKKIKSSQEIILIFPIWWWGMPAIMKNFFDTNLTSGFSFKYVKWWCQKLLKWTIAKVFCTCDWPGLIYTLPFVPDNISYFLKIYVLWFFWIDLIKFRLFDRMRKRTDKQKEKWLKEIELIAQDKCLWFKVRKYIKTKINTVFTNKCVKK